MACTWSNKLITVALALLTQGACEPPLKCEDNHRCVPFSQCQAHNSDAFIYPCHSGLNLICCPLGSFTNIGHLENRKTSLFPVNCGIIVTSDKISGGKKADLGQFPWMSLLGYRQKGIDYVQFLCGGSIITEYFVLSAAHCITLDRRLELTVIRVGEHDLLTNRDCIQLHSRVCADPHVDVPIDRVLPHPQYSNRNLQNDVALIKVRQKISFTDYVKPICLPFERKFDTLDLTKLKLIVSGWGKTNAANLGGSTTLQFTSVIVWNQTSCEKKVPPEVKPIRSNQLCANGPTKEDACKGDSGGPLINATIDQGDLRFFQIGIVSFASSLTCGDPTLPTVYTRVDKYLDWIIENVD